MLDNLNGLCKQGVGGESPSST